MQFTDEGMVKIDMGLFLEETTGGGCAAYKYRINGDYFIYVTNEAQTEISFRDTTITIGLYRNDQQFDDGNKMAIWYNKNILDFQAIFEEAFTMTERDYNIVDLKLKEQDMMVIEYLKTDSKSLPTHYGDLQREFFDLRDLNYDIEESIEALHRLLGHNQFTVTTIYV